MVVHVLHVGAKGTYAATEGNVHVEVQSVRSQGYWHLLPGESEMALVSGEEHSQQRWQQRFHLM